MALYIVDSNFFIQAHRHNYPLDVASSYWNKVKKLAESGKIISIDKVRNEIFINDDDLKSWCKDNLPDDFFKDTSVLNKEYKSVLNCASSSQKYTQKALEEFYHADEADAFLITYAFEDSNLRTIVTYENGNLNKPSKVKIPDICSNLKVSCIAPIAMFREMQETF